MEELEKQSFLSLLLSHRPPEQWHLCYRFELAGRQWAVCARCLGIFPAMIATFVLGQLSGRWPAWAEWAVLMLAPLPALVEWAVTVVTAGPDRSNWARTMTGIGMGVGIGGALHVNSYALLNEPVSAQFLMVVGTVFLAKLVAYLRFGLKRRRQLKERLRNRPTLEEYIRRSFQQKE